MTTAARPILLMLAAVAALAIPASVDGQQRTARATELGIDAGAVFGLGDDSSIDIIVPGSRARVGFLLNEGRWSVEPAAGFAYRDREGSDGVFSYDIEVGLLYHLRPFVLATADEREIIARVSSPYVRPFVGITGFTGGDNDDSEVSLGAGLGVKIPWREQLAWRLEANVGYGFDNEAFRLGALAGISYFLR